MKKYHHLIKKQIIIEQAKFNYSPLRKGFKNQIKTIKDQKEKQTKATQNQGPIKYAFDDEYTSLISKQKKIFNEHVDGSLEEITDLDERVNNDNLIRR